MKKTRKHRVKRARSIAFTIRIDELIYGKLQESAQQRGWSLQQLIHWLIQFARPMIAPHLNEEGIKAASAAWDRAKRIQEAKAAGEMLVKAARQTDPNPAQTERIVDAIISGNLAEGIRIPRKTKPKKD